MNDQMWTALGDEVEPDWTPEREGAVRAAIARRATRQRAVLRTAVAVASTGLIAVGGFALVSWRVGGPRQRSVGFGRKHGLARAGRPRRDRDRDRHRDATVARYRARPTAGSRRARVCAARRRCAVLGSTRHPPSLRRGLPGDVTIEDLGTTFTVRYLAADRLNIAVEEGRVRVRAGGTDTEVPAGATLEVPVVAARRSLAETAAAGQRGRRHRGGRSPSVVNTKRRGRRYGRPAPAPCATTPPICCWPRTPLA